MTAPCRREASRSRSLKSRILGRKRRAIGAISAMLGNVKVSTVAPVRGEGADHLLHLPRDDDRVAPRAGDVVHPGHHRHQVGLERQGGATCWARIWAARRPRTARLA